MNDTHGGRGTWGPVWSNDLPEVSHLVVENRRRVLVESVNSGSGPRCTLCWGCDLGCGPSRPASVCSSVQWAPALSILQVQGEHTARRPVLVRTLA